MGTAFDAAVLAEEFVGVVPRAVEQIFAGIERRRAEALEKKEPPPNFTIDVQFVEVGDAERFLVLYSLF